MVYRLEECNRATVCNQRQIIFRQERRAKEGLDGESLLELSIWRGLFTEEIDIAYISSLPTIM